MKITRSVLRKIITEASHEMWMTGQSDYEDQQAILQSNEFNEDYNDEYHFQMAAEERHSEEQDQMFDLAKDTLSSLIGNGISSEALLGLIRRHPDLKFYPFETIMMAIDELDTKGKITGRFGAGLDN